MKFFGKTSRDRRQDNETRQYPRVSIKFSIGTSEIVPVESRLKNIRPDRFGLFPHEILALYYVPSFSTTATEFQQFWLYGYGVSDMPSLLAQLVTRGFVEMGDLSDALVHEQVPGLKKILASHNLRVSGKKSELVSRIESSISHPELERLVTKRFYRLSAAGQAALDNSPQIPYVHKHDVGLDIFELTRLMQQSPSVPFENLIWTHLESQSGDFAKNGDWGLARNNRLTMAEIAAKSLDFNLAVRLALEVTFYDTSGRDNGFSLEYLDISAPFLFPYEESQARVVPYVMDHMFKWKDMAELSDSDFRELATSTYLEMPGAFHLFTCEEWVSLIFLERASSTEEIVSLYLTAERRLRDKYHVKTRRQ